MKRILAAILSAAVLCVGLLCLAGCDTEEELGSLEDLSRPYAGIYLCEELTLAGEDKLASFEDIRLELCRGGEFTVSYKRVTGGEGKLSGRYEMDVEKNRVTFSAKQGVRTMSRTYPLEKGCILIEVNFLGRLLFAKFKPE